MARLTTSVPPSLKAGASYRAYRPWLEEIFLIRSCAYCLVALVGEHIDHYEPKEYAPRRINDPTNLLLACASCNVSKNDYHPKHANRRVCKHGKHHLLNICDDDASTFYELRADGTLAAITKNGADINRSIFHETLLDINSPDKKERRADILEALNIYAAYMAAKYKPSRLERQAMRLIEKQISQWHVLATVLELS